jgi:hypothetical protein
MLADMIDQPPNRTLAGSGEILPPDGSAGRVLVPTPAGAAALAAAQAFAGRGHRGGHDRRLSRQPGRKPRAGDHPPAAVGDRQDASLQRPAAERRPS